MMMGLKDLVHGKRKEKRIGKRKPKVLVLLDWENFTLNFKPNDPPLPERINTCMREIARQVGSIVGVFVFLPPHASYVWGPQLRRQGFFMLVCPKIRDKTGEEIDTTDISLMEFGNMMLDNMEGLTHLGLGSGDIDFAPLLQKAKMSGLEIIIIVPGPQSLSKKMKDFIDREPYFLSSNCSVN